MDNMNEADNQQQEDEQNLDLVRNKVFGNPLILLKILRKLPHLDILECRKVSPWWSAIASKALGNNCGHLHFEYCGSLGRFIRTKPQIDPSLSPEYERDYLLPSFWSASINYANRHENLFKKGETFIEDYYTLHDYTKFMLEPQTGMLFNRIKLGLWGTMGLNDKVELQEFLSLHGSKVVELGVELVTQPRQIADSLKFLTFIFGHMLNLEKLHIGVRIQSPIVVQLFGRVDQGMNMDVPVHVVAQFRENMRQVNLPKLKDLLWTNWMNEKAMGEQNAAETAPWFVQFLDCIVNSAPDLRRNVQVPLSHFRTDESESVFIKRVASVHQLTFKPNEDDINLYMKFSNGGPQLSSISCKLQVLGARIMTESGMLAHEAQNVLHIMSTIAFDPDTAQQFVINDERDLMFENKVKLTLGKILGSSQMTLKQVEGKSQLEDLHCSGDLLPLLPPTSKCGQVLVSNAQESCPLPNSIMTKILDNLPASLLLKTTRLVCRQWRNISNQILIQRRSLQINFIFNPQHQRYILHHSKNSNSSPSDGPAVPPKAVIPKFVEDLPTLHKLNDCLQRVGISSSFPCVRFRFDNNSVSSLDFPEFFQVYGSKVKELEIEFVDIIGNCLVPILKLVQNELSSLEVLAFIRNLGQKGGTEIPPGTIISPISALKNFKIDFNDHEMSWISKLEDIVIFRELRHEFRQVDPATCTVDQWTPAFLYTHLELKNPLDLEDGSNIDSFLEKLEQLARSCQKILSLNVDLKMLCCRRPEVKNRICDAVKKIIYYNSSSLTNLQWIQHLQLFDEPATRFLSHLSFPNIRAVNLTQLKLNTNEAVQPDNETRRSNKIPKLSLTPCDLSSCFPNLQEVTLNYANHEIYERRPALQVTFAKKVKKLILQDLGDASWIQQMSKAFPQVKELVWIIKKPEIFTSTAPDVWKSFKAVKTLTLEFHMDNITNSNAGSTKGNNFKLDGGFTGFSEEVCDQLTEAGDKMANAKADKLRTRPSILNLKDLRVLELIFIDRRETGEVWNFLRSQVAGRFAFAKNVFRASILLRVKTSLELQNKYKEILLPFELDFLIDWQIIQDDKQ